MAIPPHHYYRWLNNIIVRFDLSEIPRGTHVERGRFRLHFKEDFHDGGREGVVIPLSRINDPSVTGNWDESTVTYNHKKQGVPWSPMISTAKP